MLKNQVRVAYVLFSILLIIYAGCEHSQSTEPQNLQPNLSSIQVNIFSKKCAVSGCHVSGGAGPMPLRNTDESFDNLVGVTSVQKPNLQRVVPNNADNSYLIQKLEGASGISGGRMPLNRNPLRQDEIATIREWINNGALNN